MSVQKNKTSILLALYYSQKLSEEENQDIIQVLFNDILYFPYKGEGYILVDDANAAKRLLEKHVDCYDFKDFYEEEGIAPGKKLGLIQGYPEDGNGRLIRTGRMNIENIHVYLKTLIKNNIIIYDFKFYYGYNLLSMAQPM